MSTCSVLCQVCNDIHSAIIHCEVCGEGLCEVAAKIHQNGKTTKDHALKPLVIEPANEVIASLLNELTHLLPMITCSLHNEEFKYYDEDCKRLLCRDCAVATHHGHRCIFIKDATITHLNFLLSKVQEVKFQSDVIKQAETATSIVRSKLSEEYERIHQDIGQRFDLVSSRQFLCFVAFNLS